MPWTFSLHLDLPPDVLGDPLLEFEWRLKFDFYWVMCNLIQIKDKATNQSIPFVPNRPQRWVLWLILWQTATGQPVRQWWLKGRQFGFSTLWATILFICSAMRGQNSLLLAHLEAPGKSIFRKTEEALEDLPELDYQPVDDDGNPTGGPVTVRIVPPTSNAQQRSLLAWVGKNSGAVFRRESAENRNAGVGETFQNAQLSEVPLYPKAQDTISTLMPAFSPTPYTHVAAEFTFRVKGDYADQMFQRGLAGKGRWLAGFAAWTWHTPYKESPQPDEPAFEPEEIAYRQKAAERGLEYPLTDDGRLIPRLQEVYDANGRITIDDLRTGIELTDEQLIFRRRMIDEFAGDVDMFSREFPLDPEDARIGQGRPLVPSSVMDTLELGRRPPLQPKKLHAKHPGIGEYVSSAGAGGKGIPRWQGGLGGRWHRFEPPFAGQTYVVWADVSSGTGVDPSGAGIWRVSYKKLVLAASFSGFIEPPDLAGVLVRAGRHYRTLATRVEGKLVGGTPSRMALERNGFGEALITALRRTYEYPHIFRYDKPMRDDNPRGHDYGFPTHWINKKPMLLEFVRVLYDGEAEIPCARVLADIRAMEYLDDMDEKIGAVKPFHDDLAMGSAIGSYFATRMGVFRNPPRDPEDDVPWNPVHPAFRSTG